MRHDSVPRLHFDDRLDVLGVIEGEGLLEVFQMKAMRNHLCQHLILSLSPSPGTGAAPRGLTTTQNKATQLSPAGFTA